MCLKKIFSTENLLERKTSQKKIFSEENLLTRILALKETKGNLLKRNVLERKCSRDNGKIPWEYLVNVSLS